MVWKLVRCWYDLGDSWDAVSWWPNSWDVIIPCSGYPKWCMLKSFDWFSPLWDPKQIQSTESLFLDIAWRICGVKYQIIHKITKLMIQSFTVQFKVSLKNCNFQQNYHSMKNGTTSQGYNRCTNSKRIAMPCCPVSSPITELQERFTWDKTGSYVGTTVSCMS